MAKVDYVYDAAGNRVPATDGLEHEDYIPTYFQARIGQSMTSVYMAAQAERQYSGVGIVQNTNTGGASSTTRPSFYGQGVYETTVAGLRPGNPIVNVYVETQDEYINQSTQFPGRLHEVELVRVSDDRSLINVEVVTKEEDIPDQFKPATDPYGPNKAWSAGGALDEKVVDITLAAPCASPPGRSRRS